MMVEISDNLITEAVKARVKDIAADALRGIASGETIRTTVFAKLKEFLAGPEANEIVRKAVTAAVTDRAKAMIARMPKERFVQMEAGETE